MSILIWTWMEQYFINLLLHKLFILCNKIAKKKLTISKLFLWSVDISYKHISTSILMNDETIKWALCNLSAILERRVITWSFGAKTKCTLYVSNFAVDSLPINWTKKCMIWNMNIECFKHYKVFSWRVFANSYQVSESDWISFRYLRR